MSRNRPSGKGHHKRQRNIVLTAFCVALIAIMLGLCAYIAHYYINLGRIRSEGERYGQLYTGRDETAEPTAMPTIIPTATPTAKPTATPTMKPTVKPTVKPTEAPTSAPTPTPTIQPTSSPTPTESPTSVPTETPEPTDTPTPSPTVTPEPTQMWSGDDMPVAVDEPIPTPNENTLVIALPTVPPVQSSFDALLAVNPDTVAFLDIEEMLSLPVVQRVGDNEYYLDHNFEREAAKEGALFMDGLNRLVPEDDCLIVYGHNMKNRTMFGQLSAYLDVTYMRKHPVIHFDTLYENRSYVVFAAFSASMEPDNRRYFDVRNVIFDEAEFDKFVLKLQSRSKYTVPIDVQYGDKLLLLVTCDYANYEGRFILALRQLRPDETESGAWAQAMGAENKGQKH